MRSSSLDKRESVDQDETPNNLATPPALEWTAEEEKAIVRKTDRNLMPLLWLLFLLSLLDRSNIGNAKTAGMVKELKMSDEEYQWLLTIFYIGYALGQPTMLLWKKIPPHILVAFLTACWGTFALLQPTAHWAGLMVLRLLLGIAETTFSPGVTFFLSFFYARSEVGLRQGIYAGAAPLASCFAGAMAYGIVQAHTSIASWKLLFLVEGAPAILCVPLAYFFLADRPSKARFLTEREKEIAVARTRKDGVTGREEGLAKAGVLEGLKDPKAYLCALVYFSLNVSYSSLPVFLPTILADMGFSSLRARGLSAPPYLAAFIVTVAACFLADQRGDRSIFMIPLCLIGFAGYLILALATSTAVRYFAVYLCAASVFPVIGLMLPFTANMSESDSKRGAGFMILNLIGQCGPFLGTRLYPTKEGPYYVKGMGVSCGFLLFAAILILILRFMLIRENRRRDELYGYVDPMKAYKAPLGSRGKVETEEGSMREGAAATKGEGGVADDGVNREWRFIL